MSYAIRVFALSAIVFLAGFSVFSAPVANAAKDVKFKEFPFEIARGERLIVQGVRGQVRLIPLAAGRTPVVRVRKVLADSAKSGASERFDALSFTVRRDAGMVIVEPRGPNTRQEWIDWSRPGQPELFIEVEAPSTPAEVHFHSGTVTANGWRESLAVSLQDGRLTVIDGDGGVRATILRGEIKIDKERGNVEIESHAAKVAVSNVTGHVRVHSFAGETTVSSVKGDVVVRSKTGAVNLAKLDGALEFDNGRGRFEATGVDGAVRGLNDDGMVTIQLAGEADVSIESQDGPVAVKPAGGMGALLKLSTEEGQIFAPDSVQVPRNSGPKNLVARLDGAAKGVIVLRSKRGTVRVR